MSPCLNGMKQKGVGEHHVHQRIEIATAKCVMQEYIALEGITIHYTHFTLHSKLVAQ
jgi:hypothetical protein